MNKSSNHSYKLLQILFISLLCKLTSNNCSEFVWTRNSSVSRKGVLQLIEYTSPGLGCSSNSKEKCVPTHPRPGSTTWSSDAIPTKILSSRITGVSLGKQKKLAKEIKKAQILGLL